MQLDDTHTLYRTWLGRELIGAGRLAQVPPCHMQVRELDQKQAWFAAETGRLSCRSLSDLRLTVRSDPNLDLRARQRWAGPYFTMCGKGVLHAKNFHPAMTGTFFGVSNSDYLSVD